MTREELDTLWFQVMRQSIEEGEDFIRYHFADLVAAEKDKEIAALREELVEAEAVRERCNERAFRLEAENERLREALLVPRWTAEEAAAELRRLRKENERLREALKAETARCAQINEDAAKRYRDAGWDGEATALRDTARQMLSHDETAIWSARHDPRG